jgi:hypothetical protein
VLDAPLTLNRFVRFYAPLAATSLLLTVTNPLLTSAMSRSVNPTIALAGFGVAFSLCGVLYSPLLVAQQVAATRLLNGHRFGHIQTFWLRLGVLFTLLAAVVAFTPLRGVGLRGRHRIQPPNRASNGGSLYAFELCRPFLASADLNYVRGTSAGAVFGPPRTCGCAPQQ